MVLMALDHASFFIARAHPYESWAGAPPFYYAHAGAGVALAFLTRWVTHLCAPGFFVLMGAGMVWLFNARLKAGWSRARILRFFVTRGLILLVIQHLLENPAWLLGVLSAAGPAAPAPGGGVNLVFHLGVISALAAAMIFWAFLIEMPAVVVLAVSGSQFRTGFGGATFALKDAATGREVASETVVVRTKRSSLNGTVTLSVRRFTVPHAGDFVLEARGLSPGIEDSGARFVLQRSHEVALAIHILRVVGSAVLLLAAIVVAVLSATGKIGHQ